MSNGKKQLQESSEDEGIEEEEEEEEPLLHRRRKTSPRRLRSASKAPSISQSLAESEDDEDTESQLKPKSRTVRPRPLPKGSNTKEKYVVEFFTKRTRPYLLRIKQEKAGRRSEQENTSTYSSGTTHRITLHSKSKTL